MPRVQPESGIQMPDFDRAGVSGRKAVAGSGQHLARIADRLRALETLIISPPGQDLGDADDVSVRRTRLQMLDLTIQELAGLSAILIGTAAHLPDADDPAISGLIDGQRLQSLSHALRAKTQTESAGGEVVLF